MTKNKLNIQVRAFMLIKSLLENFTPVWLMLLLALPVGLSLREFWGGSAAREDLFAPPASLLASEFPNAFGGSKEVSASSEGKSMSPPPPGWGYFFQERKSLVRFRVAAGFVGVASFIAMFVAGAALVKYKRPWLILVALSFGLVVGTWRNLLDGKGKPTQGAGAAKTSIREGVPDEVIQKIFEARGRLHNPGNLSTTLSEAEYNQTVSADAEKLAAWLRHVVQNSMLIAMVGLSFALFGFSSLLTNLKGRDVTLADVRQRLDHMREIMFTASLLLVSGVACTSCMHEFLFFSVKHVEGVAAYAEILNLRTGAQYTALLALAYWTTLLPLEKRAEELGALAGTPPVPGNAAPTAAATGLLPDGWKTMLPRLLGILAPLLTEPLMKVLDMGFHGLQ